MGNECARYKQVTLSVGLGSVCVCVLYHVEQARSGYCVYDGTQKSEVRQFQMI